MHPHRRDAGSMPCCAAGIGYRTAIARSTGNLTYWNTSAGIAYSPRANEPPVSWNASVADFDYGGGVPQSHSIGRTSL